MTDEKSKTENTQTKVEVELNSNEGKMCVIVTCDGSKLTKADSGRYNELREEVWVSVKSTKADAGKFPDLDVSIHEKSESKVTKADAGKTA